MSKIASTTNISSLARSFPVCYGVAILQSGVGITLVDCVSLFVTCVVDQFYPEVGEATVTVLRRLGVEVDFPQAQTCCGQPAFNSGFHSDARTVARRTLDVFENSEYVVIPSGSCGAMVKVFAPGLFTDDPDLAGRARDLAGRVYEFSDFLVNVLGVDDVGASYSGKVAYHPSCHLLRELGVQDAPLKLIEGVRGVDYVGMGQSETCCGFGGTFSVKYPELSSALLNDKIRSIEASGAQTLVSCDAGCLMHIGGGLRRLRSSVRVMHLAELLASPGRHPNS